MGGEAIKALQVYLELEQRGAYSANHARTRQGGAHSQLPRHELSCVKDTWLQKLAYRAGLLNPLLSVVANPLILVAFSGDLRER